MAKQKSPAITLAMLLDAGFPAHEFRGAPCIGYTEVTAMIGGWPVSFTRRRYGDATFAWVHYYRAGKWIELGTPWQCVRPAAAEILREIELAEQHAQAWNSVASV